MFYTVEDSPSMSLPSLQKLSCRECAYVLYLTSSSGRSAFDFVSHSLSLPGRLRGPRPGRPFRVRLHICPCTSRADPCLSPWAIWGPRVTERVPDGETAALVCAQRARAAAGMAGCLVLAARDLVWWGARGGQWSPLLLLRADGW